MVKGTTLKWLRRVTIAAGISFFMLTPITDARTHVVSKDESLWKISQWYGVSSEKILASNNLASNEIYPGQKLTIPDNVQSLYVVQKGDSLFLIAKKYGISVSQLKQLNGIKGNEIYPGHQLAVSNATNGSNNAKYTVQKGDSLYLIAKRYGTSVNALKSQNNLKSDEVWVGKVLTLPQGTGGNQTTVAQTQGGWSIPSGVSLYYVKSGDSISSIAQKFGTSAWAIKETNYMKLDLLQPGQALFVPTSQKPVYGVKMPEGQHKAGFGEMVKWEYANWFFISGGVATVKDIWSGKSFQAYRIGGGNHADCEPLTANDTAIMKSIYGGSWSWNTRPVLVTYKGRTMAASMAGMPHAFDTVSGNNFNGMFDLHFLNSRTHKTNKEDAKHQATVRQAAGY